MIGGEEWKEEKCGRRCGVGHGEEGGVEEVEYNGRSRGGGAVWEKKECAGRMSGG